LSVLELTQIYTRVDCKGNGLCLLCYLFNLHASQAYRETELCVVFVCICFESF